MSDIKLLQKNGNIPERATLADVVRVLNRALLRVKATDLEGVFDPDLTVGDDSEVKLRSETGTSTRAPNLSLYTASTLRAWVGVAQANADLLADAVALDLVVRTEGGAIRFTVDSGATTAVQITTTGKLSTSASSTTRAGINIPHGAAPTSPVNGDMWTTTAGLFVRINGATVGPLS